MLPSLRRPMARGARRRVYVGKMKLSQVHRSPHREQIMKRELLETERVVPGLRFQGVLRDGVHGRA